MDLKLTDFLLLALLVGGVFGAGFASGKYYEVRSWHAKLPGAMDLLCTECERTGEEVTMERLERDGQLCH